MRRSPSARWRMPLERAAQKDFRVEQFQTLPLLLRPQGASLMKSAGSGENRGQGSFELMRQRVQHDPPEHFRLGHGSRVARTLKGE